MPILLLRKTTKLKKNTNSNLFGGITGLLSQPEVKMLESEKEGKPIEMGPIPEGFSHWGI